MYKSEGDGQKSFRQNGAYSLESAAVTILHLWFPFSGI